MDEAMTHRRVSGQCPPQRTTTIGSAVRIVTALAGLTGLGIVVAEVLKKWRLLPETLHPLWIAAALATLYIARRFARSKVLADRLGLSPKIVRCLRKTFDILLLVVSVAAVLSIPFLWYGTIKELAGTGKWY